MDSHTPAKHARTSVIRTTFGPLLLLGLTPPTVMVVWYTHTVLEGSVQQLLALFRRDGVFQTIDHIWRPVCFGSTTAWVIIGSFAVWQLCLMRLLPGQTVEGPVTPAGHIPSYKANGVPAFLLTLGLFYLGAYPLHLFSPGIVYDHFGAILGALNVLSPLLCLCLYWKGRMAPSTPDAGSSGNIIFDYYWGTELHPRIFGWDVKMFTNCRFGMMGTEL